MYLEYFEEEVKRVTKELVKYAEDKNYKFMKYNIDYLNRMLEEAEKLKGDILK